ncbi:hypothetical protein MTR67_018122 [Solanum verrucosum]|uniref:Uncharacterized protein n=1 Tax=Solanum verrucosum TaxID=315347 RepID=A0AAF0QL45_SOLVR|nr:hypothetical protein MTR67_018122 [Solanum verrucosum]
MDPEQTFIRVQERFAQMLTPRIRATLEYLYLFMAVTLFCILVVMHANYVQQPGCSSELSRVNISDAQLIQIKIWSTYLEYFDHILDREVLIGTTTTLKASHISLLPYGPPNHYWDNPPSGLVCIATAFIVPAFYSLTCPLWHGPVCAPEACK